MVKVINKKLVFGKLPQRPEDSNKGTFGRVLNVAGSANYSGAAYLSSVAALKIGAGYLRLACPDVIIPVIASMTPEITFEPLTSTKNGVIASDNKIKDLFSYDVISIGCGISTDEETRDFLFCFLNELNARQKVVIDADGINILAGHKGEISLKNIVITPHPKELSRLLNVSMEEIIDNREKYARITSQTFECITVLKGHKTIVTDGEKIFINSSGNSALAKAGSGDVLTGFISGLLAQKMLPIDAAVLGVFLHGLAGDIASEDFTKYSVFASDIIDYLPFAIKELIADD